MLKQHRESGQLPVSSSVSTLGQGRQYQSSQVRANVLARPKVQSKFFSQGADVEEDVNAIADEKLPLGNIKNI